MNHPNDLRYLLQRISFIGEWSPRISYQFLNFVNVFTDLYCSLRNNNQMPLSNPEYWYRIPRQEPYVHYQHHPDHYAYSEEPAPTRFEEDYPMSDSTNQFTATEFLAATLSDYVNLLFRPRNTIPFLQNILRQSFAEQKETHHYPANPELVKKLPKFIRNSASSNDQACSICQTEEETEPQVRTQLPCLHEFHPECISTWLSSNSTCPNCRYPLLTNDEKYNETVVRPKQQEFQPIIKELLQKRRMETCVNLGFAPEDQDNCTLLSGDSTRIKFVSCGHIYHHDCLKSSLAIYRLPPMDVSTPNASRSTVCPYCKEQSVYHIV